MTASILTQLQAATPAPQREDKRTARAGRIVPDSSSDRILALMADDEVRSSILVSDLLDLPRTTARSAMDRLVRFGRLDMVGRVTSDAGGRTPLKLYRRKK